MDSTTDYDMFCLAKENRGISELKVRRLIERIKDKNFLMENPLIVKAHDKYKDKFYILDGQHRFESARRLGLPVWYIVSTTMTILDVPDINSARASWTTKDYLRHYVAMGNKDYEIIQFYVDKYRLPIYPTIRVISDIPMMKIRETFKDGLIKLSKTLHAKERFEMIEEYKGHFGSYRSGSFVAAVLIAIRSGNYDPKRMANKMEYLSRKLVKCPDTITYLELLTDIYNYNQAANEQVSFLSGMKV